MSDASPCPCGGFPLYHFLDGMHALICDECGLATKAYEHQAGARHEWETKPERKRH